MCTILGLRKCENKRKTKCISKYVTTYNSQFYDKNERLKYYNDAYFRRPPVKVIIPEEIIDPEAELERREQERRKLFKFCPPEWTANNIMGLLLPRRTLPYEANIEDTEEDLRQRKCEINAWEESLIVKVIEKQKCPCSTITSHQIDFPPKPIPIKEEEDETEVVEEGTDIIIEIEREEGEEKPREKETPKHDGSMAILIHQQDDREQEERQLKLKKLSQKRPLDFTFEDSSRFSPTGMRQKWGFAQSACRYKLSEYRESISKVGCIIMKNNIHDHRNCPPWRCEHKLEDECLHFPDES
ncbi:uncharacterized protein LOC119662706 [Teleopsis dalmanni]|uniref:uncharacterized protein LOC119662706 n=1 Tax=Teleopsis dalmanni TaxID=139649 RepID=UPI0018CECF9A|nr:uncharacterized protein LOC119662706 [Teleopsis dalmanni]